MFTERTSVGLDVHARSVVAHAMDVQTGEIFKARLCPDPAEVTAGIKTLPGPAAAIYKARPDRIRPRQNTPVARHQDGRRGPVQAATAFGIEGEDRRD